MGELGAGHGVCDTQELLLQRPHLELDLQNGEVTNPPDFLVHQELK